MTILVTGGTGLVGSRLLRRLVADGVACRGVVRIGKDLPVGVERVEGDVLDASSLAPALDGVTSVVHLAAVFRTSDEDAIWRVNLEGTRVLLGAMRRTAPAARLVFASTSNVYDFDGARPGREDDALHPTLAYPASKVAAEQLVRDSGSTWSIVRFPFVYGDGDGHLAAFAGSGIHPAQRFSLIHHEDVATAVQLALAGRFDGRTVNIADEAPMTVYEMSALAGVDYPPSSEPLTNPWRGQVDTTLAQSLGFRAGVATIHEAARAGRL